VCGHGFTFSATVVGKAPATTTASHRLAPHPRRTARAQRAGGEAMAARRGWSRGVATRASRSGRALAAVGCATSCRTARGGCWPSASTRRPTAGRPSRWTSRRAPSASARRAWPRARPSRSPSSGSASRTPGSTSAASPRAPAAPRPAPSPRAAAAARIRSVCCGSRGWAGGALVGGGDRPAAQPVALRTRPGVCLPIAGAHRIGAEAVAPASLNREQDADVSRVRRV